MNAITVSSAKEKTKQMSYLASTVGRRKDAVARIFLTSGSGKIFINGREFKEYFPKATSRYVVNQPLQLLRCNDKYDIKVNVKGGGTTGQSGAIRLAIARALVKLSAINRPELRKAGFLTRDPRAVERKKSGMSGARKRYQYSKR